MQIQIHTYLRTYMPAYMQFYVHTKVGEISGDHVLGEMTGTRSWMHANVRGECLG